MALDFNDASPQGQPDNITEHPTARKARILRAVQLRIREFVRDLFPHATGLKSDTARIGNINGEHGSSLAICLSPMDKAGHWKEFAAGGGTRKGGDVFDLYAETHNLSRSDFPHILDALEQWAGGMPPEVMRQRQAVQQTIAKPAVEIPKTVATFHYLSSTGEKLFDVVRIEFDDEAGNPILKDGKRKKIYKPRLPGGSTYTYPPGPRALYRIPDIDQAQHVVLVEGEPCADALNAIGIVATTAPGGSSIRMDSVDWRPLAGKSVTLWPDNDDPGMAYMKNAANHLRSVGCKVRELTPPAGKPEKWDAVDALTEGFDVHGFLKEPEKSDLPPMITPTAWEFLTPASIPPRQWLYGRDLCRGLLSVTVAPGGVGKSSLSLVEALAMASGKKLLDTPLPKGRQTVWAINLEDPRDELNRRLVAAAIYYGLTPSDLGNRLYVDSGLERPLRTATMSKHGSFDIVEPVYEHIEKEIRDRKIDVIIVDPFVSSHELSENDNMMIDRIAKRWAMLAYRCGVAISLVHHTRKPDAKDSELTADSARGASALIAAARIVRVLNRMTKDEAAGANLQEEARRSFFRVSRDKQNLAPADQDKNWYRMVGVPLGNGTPPHHHDGDEVGVATRWKWPEATEAYPDAVILEVQRVVDAGNYSLNWQAGDWVGYAVGQLLELNPEDQGDRRRIKHQIDAWAARKLFTEERVYSTRSGRERPVLRVANWIAKQ